MGNDIFCSECFFIILNNKEVICNHKENSVEEKTWIRKETKYKAHPRDINKDNDCHLFAKTL